MQPEFKKERSRDDGDNEARATLYADSKTERDSDKKTRIHFYFNCKADADKVIFFKTDETEKELEVQLGETLSSAVIDSGAPDTVWHGVLHQDGMVTYHW